MQELTLLATAVTDIPRGHRTLLGIPRHDLTPPTTERDPQHELQPRRRQLRPDLHALSCLCTTHFSTIQITLPNTTRHASLYLAQCGAASPLSIGHFADRSSPGLPRSRAPSDSFGPSCQHMSAPVTVKTMDYVSVAARRWI